MLRQAQHERGGATILQMFVSNVRNRLFPDTASVEMVGLMTFSRPNHAQ